MQTPDWPKKTRELHNHHMDSTIWNDLSFRDDDIVISTYAKSGTTWMQQIVGQITHGGDPELDVANMSPWLDLRVPPKEIKLPEVEAQTHRRFLKTHLPVDALVYSPKAKYIYVGRDPRDVVWSFYNHHMNSNEVLYDALNTTPGLVGPKFEPPGLEIHDYWRRWLREDGYPLWSFWENAASWWNIRRLPNLLMVHFADLKRDLPGEMKRIAAFLDVDIDEARWPSVVEYCTFDWMKANAAKSAPAGGIFWEGGAGTFINKGTNGRWRDTLTAADIDEYEALANEKLGAACAAWFAAGATAGGDPLSVETR